jgi:hypothetical protein
MGLLLLIVLILLLAGVAPAWPYSRKWGYYPGGAVTLLIVLVVVLILLGPIPWLGPPVGP